MADFSTLVKDIDAVVTGRKEPAEVAHSVDSVSFSRWFDEFRPRDPKGLRFSELGDPCFRRILYKLKDTSAEDLPSSSRIKFLYGDVLESLVLRLAEVAGHTVTGQQDKITYKLNDGWTIKGKIDGKIDGVLVDVKSTTKYGVEKFRGGLLDDPFGYYHQLNGYAAALGEKEASFVTIQKELGHIEVFPIAVNESKFKSRAGKLVHVASNNKPEDIPTFDTVPQSSTSKNMKLCTSCSYCKYKKNCFPGVRAFLYEKGPVFLTKIVSLPKVTEVEVS